MCALQLCMVFCKMCNLILLSSLSYKTCYFIFKIIHFSLFFCLPPSPLKASLPPTKSLFQFPVLLFCWAFSWGLTGFNHGPCCGHGYESIHWSVNDSPVATSLKTTDFSLPATLDCHQLLCISFILVYTPCSPPQLL